MLQFKRLTIKNIADIQALHPMTCSLLAGFCFQLALAHNKSMALDAENPKWMDLSTWIDLGVVNEVTCVQLFSQAGAKRFSVLIDEMFFANIHHYFYLGFIKIAQTHTSVSMHKLYAQRIKRVITYAKSKKNRYVYSHVLNPNIIQILEEQKFKPSGPTNTGLPCLLALKL